MVRSTNGISSPNSKKPKRQDIDNDAKPAVTTADLFTEPTSHVKAEQSIVSTQDNSKCASTTHQTQVNIHVPKPSSYNDAKWKSKCAYELKWNIAFFLAAVTSFNMRPIIKSVVPHRESAIYDPYDNEVFIMSFIRMFISFIYIIQLIYSLNQFGLMYYYYRWISISTKYNLNTELKDELITRGRKVWAINRSLIIIIQILKT